MDTSWNFVCVCLCVCLQLTAGTSERFYMEDECARTVDMEKLALESVRVELTKFQEYHNNMDCIFRISAPTNKRLEIKVLKNDIERSDGCEKDFLQLYDGRELIDPILPELDTRVCLVTGLHPSYTTTGDYVTIRFKSDAGQTGDGFRLLVTAFRTDPDDVCYNTEFQCKSNQRCISERLVCDTFQDCTDASDECGLSTPAIIGLAVGGVVVVMAIIGVVVCCCCCKRRRSRSGSTKHLNQDSSDGQVNPVDDNEPADIHYYRPSSLHQPVREYSGHTYHSDIGHTYDSPLYKSSSYHKPEMTHPGRHVYITAPPSQKGSTIIVPYRY